MGLRERLIKEEEYRGAPPALAAFEAPRQFAFALARGSAAELKLGYSASNAILAMKEIFPEVSEERTELIRAQIEDQIAKGEFYAPAEKAEAV